MYLILLGSLLICKTIIHITNLIKMEKLSFILTDEAYYDISRKLLDYDELRIIHPLSLKESRVVDWQYVLSL